MTPSRIQRLSLTHFRNYRAGIVQARGDVVVLVGPNGAGKTNCLEAISFLSPGGGLGGATLEDVADNQGDGSWAVAAEVEGALGLATLGTGIDAPAAEGASTSRRCRIDREPVNSATAFGDHLRMVWLTPAMDGLFLGAASERRRFFDRLGVGVTKADTRPGAAAVFPPAGARDRQRAHRPGLGARPQFALAQPSAGGAQLRRPLVRRDRARNRRTRGCGGGDARPDCGKTRGDAARPRRSSR